MAQRRSKNRRLSSRRSSNTSFLNDNTDVFDNDDDLLWFNKSAVRPSASLALTRNASSLLDVNSTVNASQLSDRWFNNLTKSNSSKLMDEAAKKNSEEHQNDEEHDSSHVTRTTESESEHESQKKRAKFRSNKKNNNKSDKSNAFLKALEKTTDSRTRNLTRAQVLEGNESETTDDESRTIKKIRPNIFKNKKRSEESNFDDVFHSDSASEKIQMNLRSRSSTSKRKSNDNISIDGVAHKLRKRQSKNLEQAPEKVSDKSLNKITNKTIVNSSVRELRSSRISKTPIKSTTPTKLSQKKSSKMNEPAVVEDTIMSVSITEKYPKKRAALFSQEHKSRTNENLFDDAFDTDASNQTSEKRLAIDQQECEKNNNTENANVSENSSIPTNIRRTVVRQSQNANVSNNKTETQEKTSDDDEDGHRHSTKHILQQSKNKSKNISKSINKTSQNTSLSNKSIRRQSTKSATSRNSKGSSVSDNKQNEENDENAALGESLDDENEKLKSGKNEKSQNRLTGQNQSKRTNKSRNSLNATNRSRIHLSTSSFDIDKNGEENPSSPEALSKSRSRLFKRKKSEEENVFDKISYTENSMVNKISQEVNLEISRTSQVNLSQIRNEFGTSSSKLVNKSVGEKTLNASLANKLVMQGSNSENENDTSNVSQKSKSRIALNESRLSSRSVNKSRKDQSLNISLNKSKAHENTKYNEQEDESDEETSTMPKFIRRTTSRLFDKIKAPVENNSDGDESLDVETPAQPIQKNESHRSSKQKTNDSLATSISEPRDANANSKSSKSVRVVIEKFSDKRISYEIEKSGRGELATNQSDKLLNESKSKNTAENTATRRTKIVETSTEVNDKSTSINQSKSKNAENNSTNQRESSCEKSAETSTDGTPEASQENPNNSGLHQKTPTSQKSQKIMNVSDYVIETPNPAQSTLNPYGKPLRRITDFFRNSIISDVNSHSPASSGASKTSAPSVNRNVEKEASNREQRNEEKEEEEVDIMNDSDVSENPLITRHISDIPEESKKSTHNEKGKALLNASKQSKSINKSIFNVEEMDETMWAEIKKKTDAIKEATEVHVKREEMLRQKEERKKARNQSKFQQAMLKLEAEKKKKQRKPADKAFYVNGKLYKQPKLPRPCPWVTDRLYRHLWRCMEPKFGSRTRIKSEKFVTNLSNIVSLINRRNVYKNYKGDLDRLLVMMAELNIIETRYEFYRFCSDFMPYSFRIKVVPMQMPGNKRNIPYNPEIVNKPILSTRRRALESDSSDNESESESRNGNKNDNDSTSGSECGPES